MNTSPGPTTREGFPFSASVFCGILVLLLVAGTVSALPEGAAGLPAPVLSLDFNEGSGNYALDTSGLGDTGTIFGSTRSSASGCGKSLIFDGTRDYVRVPYTIRNHPTGALSVTLWFYTDSSYPQSLVSTYHEGGYRLGFSDANDLFWTVNVNGAGDVSVPVQHESITPRQWHHVAAVYDGTTSRIYLDGILRNQVNASAPIHYLYSNDVILGANAGAGQNPDTENPEYFRGALDNVRIYDKALTQGQVLDDRFLCSQEPGVTNLVLGEQQTTKSAISSGELTLKPGESAVRVLSFLNQTINGTWSVGIPPGAKLVVRVQDQYQKIYPDAWYIEIDDANSRISRGVAFPNTNNAPVEGVSATGDAKVLIRYFDGPGRFPSTVSVRFECIPPQLKAEPRISILENPIIVIYSASWVTLIALILVMVWLHVRTKRSKK